MINIDSSYKTWEDLGIDVFTKTDKILEIFESFLGSNKYLIIFLKEKTNITSECARIMFNPLIISKDEDEYCRSVDFRGQCIKLFNVDFKTHLGFRVENHINTNIKFFIYESQKLDEVYFKVVQREEINEILFNATFIVYNTCVSFLK